MYLDKICGESNKEKKEQPKRNVVRPKKWEEKPKSTNSGKGYKYALGKNSENLTNKQKSCLDELRTQYPLMFKGYLLKEGLRKVFHSAKENVESELNAWSSWAADAG